MTVLDHLVWTAVLVAGIALTIWYGMAWRVLAAALVRAEQRDAAPGATAPAREPVALGATPQPVAGRTPVRPGP